MKIILFVLAVCLWSVPLKAATLRDSVPAFPGAEGFGAYTSGGRGGKIYIVRTLNDSGPGSFREACEAKGPRIVVFSVSGVIDLQSPLLVTNPYLTIAGQTAPGEGICLKRSEFKIYAHDVIVRYIRSRPGNISGKEMDAMGVGKGAHHVVIDHCSANWSIDECLSPSGDIRDVTVQWCLIGQPLNKSVHQKGSHGFGSLVRGIGGITLHHNLWIDNNARNPRLGDNYDTPPWPTLDVRNNVMYNWESMCSGMTGGNISVNYVANYLRPGPNSRDLAPIVLTETSKAVFYLEGNRVEGKPQYEEKPENMFTSLGDRDLQALYRLNTVPFAVPVVKTSTAEQAYQDVLSGVGAVLPKRDRIDEGLIREVKTNTGRLINSQEDVGGWPVYHQGKALVDSDQDGMPDDWENEQGLNPRDPADAAHPSKEEIGYTNIEHYINQIQ